MASNRGPGAVQSDYERQQTNHGSYGGVPSSNAMAATALLRLGKLTGRVSYVEAAARTLHAAAGVMQASPEAVGQMLVATDLFLGPTSELAIVGNKKRTVGEAVQSMKKAYLPRHVLACRTESAEHTSPLLEPLFDGKTPSDDPQLFVCEEFACQRPVVGLRAIEIWVNDQEPNPNE